MTNQTFKKTLAITDAEFDTFGAIGAEFYRKGHFDKAKTIFCGLVEIEPDNAGAHAALGAVLALSQLDGEAVTHLEKSIELDPNEIAPYVNLAEIQIRRQDLESAVGNLKRAIRLDPKKKNEAANRARMMIAAIDRIVLIELRNNLNQQKSLALGIK